jgi:hypothetical protein
MATSDDLNVAAELAQIRGELSTGFARLEGAINMLGQSVTRTQTDVNELEARVSSLEARRWPMGLVATISGVVSAAVAVLAVLVQV